MPLVSARETIPAAELEKKLDWKTSRAPSRPNPVGISTVKLIKIEKNILHIENVDILDGTPLLDIKPHVPEFDQSTAVKIGWLEDAKGMVKGKKSDSRFD